MAGCIFCQNMLKFKVFFDSIATEANPQRRQALTKSVHIFSIISMVRTSRTLREPDILLSALMNMDRRLEGDSQRACEGSHNGTAVWLRSHVQ